jgi:hypothetical protein
LRLHGPQGAELKVKPCHSCGGCVDISIDDRTEVAKLKDAIADEIREQNILRLDIATKDASIEKLTAQLAGLSQERVDEVGGSTAAVTPENSR